MKPKPFALLNHFTLPFILDTFLFSERARQGTATTAHWNLVRFFLDLPLCLEMRQLNAE